MAIEINADQRITEIYNQGSDTYSQNRADAQQWLGTAGTYWVHCFTNNSPNSPRYRVYVCARPDKTHKVLRQLLQGYNQSLKFKVAAFDEAQVRNDTIVSWHADLNEARAWAAIASANVAWLEGEAPATTFGGHNTRAVGIDTETRGDTSTSRVARAAEEEVERRQMKDQNRSTKGYHEI